MRQTQRQQEASIGRSAWLATIVLMALLTGCQSTSSGTSDPDRDDDGLTNAEEAALGTDPDNPDSDGDTLLDGDEVEAGTSPLAADSDGDGLRDDIDPDPLVPEGMGATSAEVETANQESEPNGTFSTANRPMAGSDDQIVVRGTIDEAGDVDVFDLGAVHAGDVLRIHVSALDDSLDAALAVFDDQGLLVIDNDDADFGAGILDPSVELTARRDGDPYYVAVTHSPAESSTGAYELVVSVTPGGEVPEVARQTVLLDFDGGVASDPLVGMMTIGPFDAQAIDESFAGQTDAVKVLIVETVAQDFASVDVRVVTTDDDPPEDPFSTIFIGHFDFMAFGIAQAVDQYNSNPSDTAVVFADSFGPEVFGVLLTVQELGTAIGNVASHEIGHLLGLVHVVDPAALMDKDSPADSLLDDQAFIEAPLSPSVFPIGSQDSLLLLSEILGLS